MKSVAKTDCCGKLSPGAFLFARVRDFQMAERRSPAARAVRVAVKSGLIPNPKTLFCSDCGAMADRYDHRDYRRHLDVSAVCATCNSKRGPGKPYPRHPKLDQALKIINRFRCYNKRQKIAAVMLIKRFYATMERK